MKNIIQEIKLNSGLINEAWSENIKQDDMDISRNPNSPDDPSEGISKKELLEKAISHFENWISKPVNLQKAKNYLKENDEKVTIRSIIDSAGSIYFVKKYGGENALIIKANYPLDIKGLIEKSSREKALPLLKSWSEKLKKWKEEGKQGAAPQIFNRKDTTKASEKPKSILLKKK